MSQIPDPTPSDPERDPGKPPPAGGDPPLHGPPGSGRGPTAELASVLVSFPPVAKQRRLTIAFRLILAIPHLVVLWALTLAAEIIGIVGWVAALFTGQLPEWAHTFITGVLRWQARVYSYVLFLTDSYPPFSFDDEPYPVRLVTTRTRVHRLPVLFRAVLLLPAALVLGLANYGLAVLSLFCWLLALVAGRLPAALHEAIAGVIRFQLRYFGYTFVLTSEYPWTGLLGDGEPIGILRPITVSADTVMSAADSGQATAAPASADPWRLQLSGGARAVVALLLTVGAVAAVAVAITAQLGPNSPVLAFSNARELLRVEGAYNQLASSVTNFESATVACTRLSCLTAQDRLVATALGSFAAEVRSAGIGGPSGSDARRLANDAAGARTSIDRLAGATTVSEYESIYVSLPLRRQLTDLNSDYDKVIHDLG